MMSVPCPCCGASGLERLLWTVPDRLWVPDSEFRLVRCGGCEFVYLNPRPDGAEIERFYPAEGYDLPGIPDPAPAAFRWRLAQIEALRPNGRLLDVGCGNGLLLTYALKRGWDAYGIDASPDGVETVKKRLADRVTLTTLPKAGYPDGAFDVVTLFEVLEHLPDPVDHLREIRRILRPGGWVCLSVPNFASLERWVFGRWWVGLDAPRHFQQFTPRSLGRCLGQAGFEVGEIRSVNADRIQMGKRAITYCQESLRYFLRDLGLYPRTAVLRDEPPTAAASRPLSVWKRALHGVEWVGFLPLVLLARVLDRENTLWASGRKP